MKRTPALLPVIGIFFFASCDAGDPSYPEMLAEEDGEEGGDEGEDAEAGEDEGEDAEAEPAPPRPIPVCDYQGQMRECGAGDGTQFCDWNDDALLWGECLVDFACQPGEEQECGFGSTQTCELVDGVPTWGTCPFTPLVLSFEVGQSIEMQASTSVFDIAGVGECLDSDWPSATTPWLAADLDRNGSIDAGNELFGSGTILELGRHATNGFVALAPFDGNRDGRITTEDPRFGELLVWRDEDADKRSLPYELTSLAEEGVQAIELDYQVLEQCDARGNCGRERSRFTFVGAAGKTSVGEVVDMYLACE